MYVWCSSAPLFTSVLTLNLLEGYAGSLRFFFVAPLVVSAGDPYPDPRSAFPVREHQALLLRVKTMLLTSTQKLPDSLGIFV